MKREQIENDTEGKTLKCAVGINSQMRTKKSGDGVIQVHLCGKCSCVCLYLQRYVVPAGQVLADCCQRGLLNASDTSVDVIN